MDTSSKKEELSIAYISALCAVAGISFDRQFHDDDSTDATIKSLSPCRTAENVRQSFVYS